MPECPHSMLPVESCAHCTGQDDRPAEAGSDASSSRPFTARFGGTCPGCGFDIRPGDRVAYRGDRLNHEGCTDG